MNNSTATLSRHPPTDTETSKGIECNDSVVQINCCIAMCGMGGRGPCSPYYMGRVSRCVPPSSFALFIYSDSSGRHSLSPLSCPSNEFSPNEMLSVGVSRCIYEVPAFVGPAGVYTQRGVEVLSLLVITPERP
ncbi:hypothetical protein DdX_04799 [Ditylenchus destructor]|uniref:Uncharacterized protein n=1 Tax=Ditylenchus destructor TaxID=166010 RepID=A0AAD4NA32_9BILA|nr:hypothetical protein DdX_04799 [Ditylenchus destructor]